MNNIFTKLIETYIWFWNQTFSLCFGVSSRVIKIQFPDCQKILKPKLQLSFIFFFLITPWEIFQERKYTTARKQSCKTLEVRDFFYACRMARDKGMIGSLHRNGEAILFY